MPYIPIERRKALWSESTTDYDNNISSVGELNYWITEALLEYVEANGESYQTINNIVGVLECAKLEFYRRLASSYEDAKIKQNGDVYNCTIEERMNGKKKKRKKS